MSLHQQSSPDPVEAGGPSLGLPDIYFILFRRKWLIILGLLAGIGAAAALYHLKKPLYQSTAKLLVKYVNVETPVLSPVTPPGGDPTVRAPNPSADTLMGSEREILYSLDVALDVTKNVTPDQILPPGPGNDDPGRAADFILKNLKVDTPVRSDIISLQFQHAIPSIAQAVLREHIQAYLKKHEVVHRGDSGIEDEKLVREIEQHRQLLLQTEDQLRAAKAEVGVVSVEEAKKMNIEQKGRIAQQLIAAEAELAGRRAALGDDAKGKGTNGASALVSAPATASLALPVPPAQREEYRLASTQAESLMKKEGELLAIWTPDSPAVKTNALLLQQAMARKARLESNYPSLVRAPASPIAAPLQVNPQDDPATQLAQIRFLQATVSTLSNKLVELRSDVAKLDRVETEVGRLTVIKEQQSSQLQRMEALLDKRRQRQALGGDRAPNISIVQAPSPAYRQMMQLYKKMVMALAGGLAGGIGLAFLLELFVDRRMKRPKDVESALADPLFVTIPDMEMPKHDVRPALAQLPASTGGSANGAGAGRSGRSPMHASHPDHPLRPYAEALRDRLINYFEIQGMTHKPKMIAVTSCEEGVGVSSTASGLAASLSETGDGNVLLVDMRGKRGAARAFLHGKPVAPLEEALESESRGNALVHDNLYVVSTESGDEKFHRVLPRQFGDIVPKLKASDYDYIIFDMPPVSQTTITSKVARFMDMVLMVIESDKTDRDVAKRARLLLAESKVNVATVLNKQRRIVPKWLLQEFH
jgi:uncharacterized protein involved in exopolysaccharide biosynthesis/Mrp family chromosome partitioning ATPase